MAKYRITKINSINGFLYGVYGITLKSKTDTSCLACDDKIQVDSKILKLKITDSSINNLEKQTLEVNDFIKKIYI